MSDGEILDLITEANTLITLPSNDDLAKIWARRLATLSEKITEDELYSLIALGVMVYQRGCREFGDGTTADLLIRTLKQGGRA